MSMPQYLFWPGALGSSGEDIDYCLPIPAAGWLAPRPLCVHLRGQGAHTNLMAAIAPVCRATGPVWVLKRVAPAEAAVAPGIGHALLERIEAAVRSSPATSSVFGAPRGSPGGPSAQDEGAQQNGCDGE